MEENLRKSGVRLKGRKPGTGSEKAQIVYLLKYLLAIHLFSLSFIATEITHTFEEHREITVNYAFTRISIPRVSDCQYFGV